MDPITAFFNFQAMLFQFLNTAAGQQLAGQIFKDGMDLRTKLDEWLGHAKEAAAKDAGKVTK